MSIFKNTPTSQFYSYRFQYDHTRYSGVCVGCTTVTQARKFEADVKAGLARLGMQKTLHELYENCQDMLIAANPVRIDKAFDLAQEKPRRRTPGTQRNSFKRKYWNDFVFFLKRRYPRVCHMQHVTPAIAENYIALIRKYGRFENHYNRKNEMLANTTCNEIHASISQIFDLLKNETGMKENPFKGIDKLPQDTDGHEAYTFEELKLIFDNADKLLYPLFMIGLFSGLRLGDICTLKKANISFERHFIYVQKQRKTGGAASIPMYSYLEEYLKSIYDTRNDSEYLLPDLAEVYLRNKSTISNWVTRFLEGLGIMTKKQIPGRTQKVNTKGIHSLRHTFCSIAGVCGIPETVVQSIVGHMTPEMTKLYSRHVEEGEKLNWIQFFGQKVSPVVTPMPSVNKIESFCNNLNRKKLMDKLAILSDDEIAKLLDSLDDEKDSFSGIHYLINKE